MSRFIRLVGNGIRLILTILRMLPTLTQDVWTWTKDKKGVCFNCWKLWYKLEPSEFRRSHGITTSEMKDDCPSCKIITVTLSRNTGIDLGRSEKFLLCDIGPGSTNFRDNRAVCLRFHPMSNWNADIWISREMDPEPEYSENVNGTEVKNVRIVTEQVNISLLQSWLNECKDHGDACALKKNSTRGSRDYDIILVDVQEQRLIHSSLTSNGSQKKFFALSYVWGPANFFKTTKSNLGSLLESGGLSQSHVSLPQTFRDAMKLMEHLGERYIWIDALCIVQDDSMKHDQLNIMDQIYGRAYLTIVSLAGSTVHDGLPGMKPGSRSERQLRSRFGKNEFIAALPSLEQAIKCSTHFTRAWTFQETFLSRRCLFVSDGEFFFWCSKGYFSESLNWREDVSLGRVAELALATSSKWHSGIYENSVEQYTRRKLSYDQDIVYAFMGALNSMEEMGYRPRGDVTMDLLSPCAMLWIPIDKNSPRRLSSSFGKMESFPSWSWAGWKGAVTYASFRFGRNISTYTTSLIWAHQSKYPGEASLLPLDADSLNMEEFCTEVGPCHDLLKLRHTVPECSSTLPDTGLIQSYIFQFSASVSTASRFQFPSWHMYKHATSNEILNVELLRICDEEGKHCGALFNASLLPTDIADLHNHVLIAMSMKKQWDWLEGILSSDYDTKDDVEIARNGCGCWLNIMLVKQSDKHDGVVERVAVGQMHPAAWAKSGPRTAVVTMM